jgi:quinol monooxygenase YgiN
VEPNGLSSPEDVIRLREKHIAAVAQMFETCDIFIFTLGLTEAWVDRTSGTVYPTAPGTIAGNYDPETVEFKNFTFGEVLDDLKAFRGELLEVNPNANILLTVSPVGLAATATEGHVLTSSVYSKSVLRAVAGQMANEYDNVDYFPSYEIVNSAASKGRFFDETYRDVTAAGVSTAMSHFLRAFPDLSEFKPTSSTHENELELAICEEILVEEFAK